PLTFDWHVIYPHFSHLSLSTPPAPRSTLFPYTTLFRSQHFGLSQPVCLAAAGGDGRLRPIVEHGFQQNRQLGHVARFRFHDQPRDRKSTRLNSSHVEISYAVFCLKKKRNHHSKLSQRPA